MGSGSLGDAGVCELSTMDGYSEGHWENMVQAETMTARDYGGDVHGEGWSCRYGLVSCGRLSGVRNGGGTAYDC